MANRYVLAAAVAALMLVAACGGDDGGSGSDTTTTTVGTTVATTAPLPTAPTVPSSTVPVVTIPNATGYTDEPAEGALRRGMKGPRVLLLQRQLQALGFDVGTPDGLFGPKTQVAVRAFQTQKALAADGVVGPQTQAAIATACQQATCPTA